MADDNENNGNVNGSMFNNSSTPNREFMINTAVHFLQNPKVQTGPLSQKRAFLNKKGLTNEEIDIAIDRVSTSSNALRAFPPNRLHDSQIVHRSSWWTRLQRYGTAAIFFGVAIYGLQQFYQLYIVPLLYGETKRQSQISQMKKQLLEMNRSLSQLRMSVAAIETCLAAQKEELQKCLTEKNEEEACMSSAAFMEIKADLSTVKSLLLNKNRFPEPPKLLPRIPKWQLDNESKHTNSDRERETLTESSEVTCDDSNNGTCENVINLPEVKSLPMTNVDSYQQVSTSEETELNGS